MNTEPAPAPAPTPRTASSHNPSRRSQTSESTRRSDDAKHFRKIMKQGGKGEAKGNKGKGLDITGRNGLLQPLGERAGREAGGDLLSQHQDRGDGSLTAGMFALQQAQLTLHQNMVQPTPTTVSNMAPALAELISRHVKQLLVPDASSRHTRSREIMITLKDDILPGTELWLSRTADGWRLRADTRSPDAYRMLTEEAPDLVERFASHRLGRLDIDPTLLD